MGAGRHRGPRGSKRDVLLVGKVWENATTGCDGLVKFIYGKPEKAGGATQT